MPPKLVKGSVEAREHMQKIRNQKGRGHSSYKAGYVKKHIAMGTFNIKKLRTTPSKNLFQIHIRQIQKKRNYYDTLPQLV